MASLRSRSLNRRFEVLERDGWRCVQCGKAGRLEVDHIVPLWRGGTDEISNMQTLCVADHIKKTRREATERTEIDGVLEWVDYVKALKKSS